MTQAVGESSRGPFMVSASAFSGGAAVIHFAAMKSHFDEYWLFGVFFLVVAIAQAVTALALLIRPPRPFLIAVIAGNAAVIVVWIVSRTGGLPLGPEPGEAEAVNFQDALASGLEALLIVTCSVLLGLRQDGALRLRTTRSRVGIGLLAMTVAALTATSLVVGGGASHNDAVAHDGGHDEEAADGAFSQSFTASAEHVTLTFSLEPATIGSNTFHLYFADEDGELEEVGDNVKVEFAASRSSSTVTGTAYPAGPGHFSGLVALPEAGTWRVTVNVTPNDGEAVTIEGSVGVE